MLQGCAIASPPLSLIPAATPSQASALRLEMTTFEPKAARASAIALPMPFVDPVMTLTLPVRSNRSFILRSPCSP